MKLRGYLCLVVLILTAVGWFRGWFVVTVVTAGNQSRVSVTAEEAELDNDAQAAVAHLSRLSDDTATTGKSAVRSDRSDESDLTGTVTQVIPKTRGCFATVGAETVTHGDAPATFDQLTSSSRVTRTFRPADEQRSLSRIAVQL